MTKPHINVTPLIDVLLVLIIIFMVVSPLKPSSFKVKLPKEPRVDQRVIPNDNTLVVTIDADSSLALNKESGLGKVVDPSALTSRLSHLFYERQLNGDVDESGNVIKTVFIKAPRGTAYGDVAKVIDAVKIAGADPVSLQIDGLGR
jgi:biopolymer transport protein ExbD